MEVINQYKTLVGAYYGIRTMDNYDLKVYMLRDMENYIKDYIITNPIPSYDYKGEADDIDQSLPLITKLQDSLIVLNWMNAPMELILLVKAKIKRLKDEMRN